MKGFSGQNSVTPLYHKIGGVGKSGKEWGGVGRSGIKWGGVEWSGEEWNRVGRSGEEWKLMVNDE